MKEFIKHVESENMQDVMRYTYAHKINCVKRDDIECREEKKATTIDANVEKTYTPVHTCTHYQGIND